MNTKIYSAAIYSTHKLDALRYLSSKRTDGYPLADLRNVHIFSAKFPWHQLARIYNTLLSLSFYLQNVINNRASRSLVYNIIHLSRFHRSCGEVIDLMTNSSTVHC